MLIKINRVIILANYNDTDLSFNGNLEMMIPAILRVS